MDCIMRTKLAGITKSKSDTIYLKIICVVKTWHIAFFLSGIRKSVPVELSCHKNLDNTSVCLLEDL